MLSVNLLDLLRIMFEIKGRTHSFIPKQITKAFEVFAVGGLDPDFVGNVVGVTKMDDIIGDDHARRFGQGCLKDSVKKLFCFHLGFNFLK